MPRAAKITSMSVQASEAAVDAPRAERALRVATEADMGAESPALRLQGDLAEMLAARDDRWSPRRRMGVMVGLSVLAWAALIAAGLALA